jgi:hypothetical protein
MTCAWTSTRRKPATPVHCAPHSFHDSLSATLKQLGGKNPVDQSHEGNNGGETITPATCNTPDG